MEENIDIGTIFSLISLIISLISLIYSIFNARKINRLNMRNNYYDIFKDDLTKTMPNLHSRFISNESNMFSDKVGEEFEKFINEFREKIKFLSYIDNKNYKCLDNLLVELEEEIILLPVRKQNKTKHIDKIDELMNSIYKKINKHFT